MMSCELRTGYGFFGIHKPAHAQDVLIDFSNKRKAKSEQKPKKKKNRSISNWDMGYDHCFVQIQKGSSSTFELFALTFLT